MTAVIGLVCGGTVFLAGDSCATGGDGDIIQPRRDVKVFRNGSYAIGASGSFRLIQLLRYSFRPPAPPEFGAIGQTEDEYLLEFMVTKFIPALSHLVTVNALAAEDAENPLIGEILVGVKGRLYHVQPDYQVAVPDLPYWAIGSEIGVCLGALEALHRAAPHLGPDTPDRAAFILATTMRIAEKFNATVTGPVQLVCTDG